MFAPLDYKGGFGHASRMTDYWLPIRNMSSHRHFRATELLNRINYDPNTWVFIIPLGSGGIYIFMSLLETFIRHHCKKDERIILLVQTKYIEVAQMFSQYSNLEFVPCTSDYMELLTSDMGLESHFSKGKAIIFSPELFERGDLLRLVYLKETSLCDIQKYMLSIPFDAQPTKPVILGKFIDSTQSKLPDIGANPILLCPSSNTFPALMPNFWPLLARRLTASGYDVYIDTANGACPPIDGTKELRFTLGEALPIADKIGHVVCYQSGLAHILSSSTCRLNILHPGPLPAPYYPYPYSCIDLKNGGFRDTSCATEISTTGTEDEAVTHAFNAIIATSGKG